MSNEQPITQPPLHVRACDLLHRPVALPAAEPWDLSSSPSTELNMIVRWSLARAAEAVRGTPSGLTMTERALVAGADMRARGSVRGHAARQDMGLVVAEHGAGRDYAVGDVAAVLSTGTCT